MPRTRLALRAEPLEDRLTPSDVGTLDLTFGVGGKVVQNTAGTFSDVAVDSVGRVVVVGTSLDAVGGGMLVLRFNADGTPDTAFGTGGTVRLDISENSGDSATGVAIDANNNIVVVGNSPFPSQMVFFRLAAADGAMDPTFGVGGTGLLSVTPPSGSLGLLSGRVVLDPGGNIYAVGTSLGTSLGSADGTTDDIAVVRVTADGSRLDPAFNGGAIKLLGANPISADEGFAIALDPLGRIVVGGQSGQSGSAAGEFTPAVVRLLADGTPDTAFNGGKVRVLPGPLETYSRAPVLVAADAAGNVYVGTTVVAKMNADGTPDTTFGTFGAVTLASPNVYFGVAGLAVTPAGRIVVGGTTGVGTGPGAPSPLTDFVAAQLLPDGTLDPAFNSNGSPPGQLVFDLGNNAYDVAHAMAIARDGKIVIAGGTNAAVEVARVIGRLPVAQERPRNLSVGESVDGFTNVYAPTAAGGYDNPPARQIQEPTLFPAVRPATGDFNGDGVEDTVLVTGPGTTTQMKVINGKDGSVLLNPVDPFGDPGFTFGAFVTAGDIDGDGRAEWVVTPDLRGGPRVIIFGLNTDGSLRLVANFFGIQDPSFRDGARAALGDVNGDGIPDVFVIAAFNGGPRTALYDGKDVLVAAGQNRQPNKLVGDFFAAPSGQDEGRGGRSIAVGDVNGDGVADLIVTGDNLLGTGNQVVIFSGADLIGGKFPGFGATPLANFTVSGQSPSALVSLAAVNADGDSRADVAVGSGAGQPSLVKVYLGRNLTRSAEPNSTSLDPFGTITLNGVFVG
jgi:uncharacterized delta-60 repeat protein